MAARGRQTSEYSGRTEPNLIERKSGNFADRLLLPLAFGLGTVVVVLGIYQLLLRQQQTKVETVTKSELLFIKNKIESELQSRILILQQLAERWQTRQPADGEWESDTAFVTSGSAGWNAIEWVDSGFRVVRIGPNSQNDVDIGLDFHSDLRRTALLENALREHITLVSRSVRLNNGENGFLMCAPIPPNQKFQGALIATFSYQNLLDSILKDVAQDDLVTVYEGLEKIYRRMGNSTSASEATASVADTYVGQLTWQVRVWPKPETLARSQSILPDLILVAGLQMSALLAFTVYSVESARSRARELAAAHEQLKSEIAEREKIEEDLRHAHKMEAVGQLAGGVAHSFNNLLLVIRGQADLLLHGLSLSEPLRRYPREILKATDNASTLTRQLLAFSRKQMLQPRVLDLNELISQTAVLLPALIGPDIKLIVSLDPELGHVKADPGQVEQVIMNLVVNARDAMPGGGELRIETANAERDSALAHPNSLSGGVHLVVKDNGCGMDEEIKSRIFEPFFSTKEKGKGTGLGLSMVYGTVEQSGGSIKVMTEPGQGTTIRIWLPRVEEEKPDVLCEVAQTSEIASPLGTETVLLVDDEEGILRVAREFLRIKGYSVLEAREAKEAIRIAEQYSGPIHLMLTDIIMPGVKGEVLVGQISALRPELKVLYMSAYTEDAVLNLGILAPGTNFIEKPFGPDDLARKIRSILHGGPAPRTQ